MSIVSGRFSSNFDNHIKMPLDDTGFVF